MKKTLLLLPFVLVMSACTSESERYRDICAQMASGQMTDEEYIEAAKELGFKDRYGHVRIMKFCEYYKSPS